MPFLAVLPRGRPSPRRTRHLLAAAQRDGHVEDTWWRVRNDGSEFWARVTISAIRNDQGQVLGFVKIVRDLTSEKQASDDRAAHGVPWLRDLLSPATALHELLALLGDELGPDHRVLRLAAEATDRILVVTETLGGVATRPLGGAGGARPSTRSCATRSRSCSR